MLHRKNSNNILSFTFYVLSFNIKKPDRDKRVNLQRLNKIQYTVIECNLW
jgi:hypothetical protein